MESRFVVQVVTARPSRVAGFLALGVLGLGWLGSVALAKEPSLTAIELYDGPTGPTYVQLTDVLINGKAEMRDCTPSQAAAMDKPTYNKLEKVFLGPGGILDRGADGVMHYNTGRGTVICVAPAGAKFDHNAALSLSDLAEQAVLRATSIGTAAEAPGAAPPIKRGVTLVFVAAPDMELAEFLRAQRAMDVAGWKSYLSRYQSSPHSGDAKLALASLYVAAGEVYLRAYDKSAGSAEPSYPDLKSAKAQGELAHALGTSLPAATKLDEAVRKRINAIAAKGRSELDAYHAALNGHTSGFGHLQNARKFSDIAGGIDSFFPAGQALAADVIQDTNALESALQSAGSAQSANQFDQAFTYVVPYRDFADEEPRVAAVIDATYGYHLGRGNQLNQASDFEGAIKEFEKASATKDTVEVRSSLKSAREQLVIARDKAAAAEALETSKAYEDKHDMLDAYETLASLPPAQLAMVTMDMDRLTPGYVLAASQEAKGLRQAHDPIRGIADEEGIQRAYKYLEIAYRLSQNESYKDRMDLLGNSLSAYLLEQAKHYFAKPGGSATELGWNYLKEAEQYKASNLDAVRDAEFTALAAHTMRSKISISVQFRDQTSQRDSTGFAGQLENAIITGLEGSGVPVKVVRSGETAVVEPDFQLSGYVLQHHLTNLPTIEPQESKYRAGEKDEIREEWNKANRAYEEANMQYEAAKTSLQGGEARGNKEEIKDLNNSLMNAEKAVKEAHIVLDSTKKYVSTDIIHTYTYTKRTVDLDGVIQLQFRIGDSFSGQMADLVPITKEVHKPFVMLEGVNAEDTEGIKNSGTPPDTSEFMTELEDQVLKELISEVRKQVEKLPRKIYDGASSREAGGDLDGAGEAYLRFLNMTSQDGSAEFRHASDFLKKQFNMEPTPQINKQL